MNLADLLDNVSLAYGERPCVASGHTELDYAQFNARVRAIAGSHIASGRASGDRVVLFMENCFEFFECLFACWAAGLVAVPVNAKLHAREVAHIISDSGAQLVLTTPGLAKSAAHASASADLVCTGTAAYDRLLAGKPVGIVPTRPDDLAWIFYTSGTTGRPKGAMLSHRNLLGVSLRYYADIDQVGPDDVKVHTAPLSHGSGLYGLPFFLRGARHIILPGFDVEVTAEVLARYDNVSMFAAPTMLTRLVNSPIVSTIDPARIRTIYYGGGPMYVADLKKALSIFGPRLYQLYGQGESPMTITGLTKALHVAKGVPPLADRLASCGVARTGVLVRVVDAEGRDLPVSQVGEVITQSDCVMAGYWNNPDATAATLKGGWLHTGDLGSLDEHGYLTLRDRSKDMIISGGSNIYPREIEELLLRHPAVLECSVVGRPHPDWGEEVVAFVVPKPAKSLNEAELDRLCLDNVARFKRPKSYRFLESLPKNNYGKVLKTDLRRRLDEEGSS